MKTKPGILSADYKVAGGKLLRVRLSLGSVQDNKIIRAISLTGDFFMHPEEAIENLERALTNLRYESTEVRQAVNTFFASGVDVIGAGPDDFIYVIMSAS